jgi:hypothetical protein
LADGQRTCLPDALIGDLLLRRSRVIRTPALGRPAIGSKPKGGRRAERHGSRGSV